MKKIASIFLVLTLMFSNNLKAETCSKAMLDQLEEINISWRPIIGNSTYSVEKNGYTITVLKLYNNNKNDADPAYTDVQAVFLKRGKNGACKLMVIVLTEESLQKYIDLITAK